MKPADIMRGRNMSDAAELFDECERVLGESEAGLWLLATSGNKAAVQMHANARATLAKLRGEA